MILDKAPSRLGLASPPSLWGRVVAAGRGVGGAQRGSCSSPCSLPRIAHLSFHKRLRDVGRLMVSNGKSSVLSPENEQQLSDGMPGDPLGLGTASVAPSQAALHTSHQPGSCWLGRKKGF